MNQLLSVTLMAAAIVIQVAMSAARIAGYMGPIPVTEANLLVASFNHQLFHAGWLHLIVNLSCLTTIVFGGFRIPKSAAFAGYAISSAVYVPSVWLAGAPTVGLSGIIYALLGMLSIHANDKLKYHGWIAAFMVIGCFTSSNIYIHFFSYLAGIAYAWMITPQNDR